MQRRAAAAARPPPSTTPRTAAIHLHHPPVQTAQLQYMHRNENTFTARNARVKGQLQHIYSNLNTFTSQLKHMYGQGITTAAAAAALSMSAKTSGRRCQTTTPLPAPGMFTVRPVWGVDGFVNLRIVCQITCGSARRGAAAARRFYRLGFRVSGSGVRV